MLNTFSVLLPFIENLKFSDGNSTYYQNCLIFLQPFRQKYISDVSQHASHLPNASQKCDWELPCSQCNLQAKMFWLCLILFLLFCAVTVCVCALTILFMKWWGKKRKGNNKVCVSVPHVAAWTHRQRRGCRIRVSLGWLVKRRFAAPDLELT